jgi:hypothetical protein
MAMSGFEGGLLQHGLQGAGATMNAVAMPFAHRGKMKQIPTMSQGPIGGSDWARMLGQQQVQNPYQGFEPIAKRAQTMFQQQTVPGLAERFSSFGDGNALSSPAFAAQLHGAGVDLSDNLAAIMAQYGLHQQELGQHLFGQGMTPQFENYYQEPGPSFLSALFSGLGGSMSKAGSGMAKQNYMKQLIEALNAGGNQ